MQFSLQWTRNDGLPASEALQFFLKGAQAPKIITVKTQSSNYLFIEFTDDIFYIVDYWEYYLDNKFFIVVPSVVTIMIGFFILILALYCKGNVYNAFVCLVVPDQSDCLVVSGTFYQ